MATSSMNGSPRQIADEQTLFTRLSSSFASSRRTSSQMSTRPSSSELFEVKFDFVQSIIKFVIQVAPFDPSLIGHWVRAGHRPHQIGRAVMQWWHHRVHRLDFIHMGEGKRLLFQRSRPFLNCIKMIL